MLLLRSLYQIRTVCAGCYANRLGVNLLRSRRPYDGQRQMFSAHGPSAACMRQFSTGKFLHDQGTSVNFLSDAQSGKKKNRAKSGHASNFKTKHNTDKEKLVEAASKKKQQHVSAKSEKKKSKPNDLQLQQIQKTESETGATKKKKGKKKKKKLTSERKQQLLETATSHSFGPLVTEFDFSEESKVEVEPDEQMIEEIEQLMREEHVSKEVWDTLQRVVMDYKNAQRDEPISDKKVFWKPEQLSNTADLTASMKEMFEWLGKLKKLNPDELHLIRKQNRQQQFEVQALHFIDACISANLVKQAHSFLVHHHKRSREQQEEQAIEMRNILTYELVMREWAKRGRLEKISELTKIVTEKKIRPTLVTYAAVLEACGRQTRNCDSNFISAVVADASREGFNLSAVPFECVLSDASTTFVEKAVRMVKPDFAFTAPRQPKGYECSLVRHLNTSEPTDDNYSPQLMENANANVSSMENLMEGFREQLHMEEQEAVLVGSVISNGQRIKGAMDPKKQLELHNHLMKKWREDLTKAFSRELGHQEIMFERNLHSKQIHLYPFLKMLPSKTYVNFMMEELRNAPQWMINFDFPLNLLTKELAKNIFKFYEKCKLRQTDYKAKLEKVYLDYLKVYNQEKVPHVNHRELFQEAMARNNLSLKSRLAVPADVPDFITKKLGNFLYEILLSDVKINSNIFRPKKTWQQGVEVPIWMTRNHVVKIKKNQFWNRTELKLHPYMKKLTKGLAQEMSFPSHAFPTLAPPIPWTGVTGGGFFLLRGEEARLVRKTEDVTTQDNQLFQAPPQQLYPILDSLNSVGATPWRINKPVLDLILEVFKKGGDEQLKIPIASDKMPQPPKIDASATFQDWARRNEIKKQANEMHSLWMTDLYRFSIANKLRDKIFWFPHNLDFRGRAYPTPPHFSHLGNDVARSMITFANAKPLGPEGLDWLKIHVVNLTGAKKRATNSERLRFANEMISQILDSADNPMDGQKWWQKSDEPWQTLAACKEVANAVRSPDPREYECSFPVHQDGSCNGLQHYAALGRDEGGAESVNVAPAAAPKDVYSDILELVEAERRQDAEAGGENAQIARILEGCLERKVIKQTIMTTVYGVTQFGARLQIERQLQKLDDFPQEYVFKASLYLVQKTFHCLQQKFTATKEIQNWLTLCAEVVSKVSNKQMSWVTPLGLPVVQPYQSQVTVYEKLPKKKAKLPKDEEKMFDEVQRRNKMYYMKPNMVKQRNAFPPNFIHSLDATHMMLTALHCLRHGVTFASVHDCFWTHPCDVAVMNKVCREQFIQLYNQPILENLAEHMYHNFGYHSGENPSNDVHPVVRHFVNHLLLKVPSRGGFQLERVRDSTYFFG